MSLTAQQYLAMRSTLLRVLAGNSSLVANPSDAEVLGFFKQLFADTAGYVALTTGKQLAMGAAAARMLSGNFVSIPNPNDADVVAFWTQLSTDSAAGTILTAQRYLVLRAVLRAQFSINYPGVTNPSEQDVLAYFGPFGVATPLTIYTSNPPLAYWDSRLGVTNTAGVATQVNDQKNANNLTPPITGPSIITSDATLSGLQTLSFSGAAKALYTAGGLALTFPFTYVLIWKPTTWNSTANIMGPQTGANTGQLTYAGTPGNIYQYNGTYGNNSAPTFGVWYRTKVVFTGSTSDSLRIGTPIAVSGTNTGNINLPANIGFNSATTGVGNGAFDLLMAMVFQGTTLPAEDTAFDVLATSLSASIQV